MRCSCIYVFRVAGMTYLIDLDLPIIVGHDRYFGLVLIWGISLKRLRYVLIENNGICFIDGLRIIHFIITR